MTTARMLADCFRHQRDRAAATLIPSRGLAWGTLDCDRGLALPHRHDSLTMELATIVVIGTEPATPNLWVWNGMTHQLALDLKDG